MAKARGSDKEIFMSNPTLGRAAKLAAAVGLTLGLGIGAASPSLARAVDEGAASAAAQAEPGAGYQPVDSFFMMHSHLESWTPVADDKVIVWPTPFEPYLIELAYPSHDLRFANAIGVTSMGSRVYAKFDAVKIAGFRYPIDNIYKLTREEAASLTAKS
jgi:hypothetical protein